MAVSQYCLKCRVFEIMDFSKKGREGQSSRLCTEMILFLSMKYFALTLFHLNLAQMQFSRASRRRAFSLYSCSFRQLSSNSGSLTFLMCLSCYYASSLLCTIRMFTKCLSNCSANDCFRLVQSVEQSLSASEYTMNTIFMQRYPLTTCLSCWTARSVSQRSALSPMKHMISTHSAAITTLSIPYYYKQSFSLDLLIKICSETIKLALMWNYIQGNLYNAVTNSMMKDFNDGFSAALNTAYDPAWNTVTTIQSSENPAYNDLVVYGYAFKNQWMWFNGYTRGSISGASFSFVVWKDYNCQAWKSLGNEVAVADEVTGFTAMQTSKITQWIRALTAIQLLDDPWGAAKSLIDTIQGSTQFVNSNDRAYSVLMQQAFASGDIFARFCVVGQEFYDSARSYSLRRLVTSEDVEYGRFILFRTR